MNGRVFSTVATLGAILGTAVSPAASSATVPDTTVVPDTVGASVVEWAGDPWAWPWVQVAGSTLLLSPRSCATFEEDTALVVRLHVRVLEAPGAEGLAWLSPDVEVTLQDDLGRRWIPVQVNRGPVVRAGLKPPPFLDDLVWMRVPVAVIQGREFLVGEHRLRFLRRDKAMGGPSIHARTKWFVLKLSYAGNEWVSNCVFRLPSAGGSRDASMRR